MTLPRPQAPSPDTALSPSREAEIAAAYARFLARRARNLMALEPMTEAQFRYASMTLEERITFDHGPDVLASLLKGGRKGMFERAFSFANLIGEANG